MRTANLFLKLFILLINHALPGLIVSNTSIDKSLLSNKDFHDYEGGLSGKPIMNKSTKLLSIIFKEDSSIPLIGVGGGHGP